MDDRVSALAEGEDDDSHRRLVALATGSASFMHLLRTARTLGLADWCIGAGAVRNLVWDALHERRSPARLDDVDLAFFDPLDPSMARDALLVERLHAIDPMIPWDVTNQAGVHRWFEAHFGHAVAPLRSLADAVASWPEYATAVGVTLERDDTVRVIAPYGLGDLFGIVIQRNPARVSVETYRERSRRSVTRNAGRKSASCRVDPPMPALNVDQSALPTVLLFDLGGVLIENVGFDRLNGLLATPLDTATLRDRWLASSSVRQFELGAITPDAFAKDFVDEWRLPLEPSDFLDEFATWPKGFHPGAVELLAELRPRFRLACLSNSNVMHWQRFDSFRDVFEVALSSHLLGEIKPDRACFARALGACRTTASEVVFFDDSAPNVTAARDLGMRAFEVVGVDAVREVLRKERLCGS